MSIPPHGLNAGIDVVDNERFEEILRKRGPGFLDRIFTERERLAVGNCQGFARLFAAKEAVMKSLGTGLSAGVSWHDIEILDAQGSSPEVVLSGAALVLAGNSDLSVSLCGSGSDTVALAVIQQGV
jgi:holo-[acyl-carrier protein] synthase